MMICIGTESCSSRDDSKDSVQDRLISEAGELSAVLQTKAPLSMRLSWKRWRLAIILPS